MINNDDGKIRSRYDTLANWDNANPTLSKGEIGVAISGNDVKLKVGDGVTPWKTLPFISGGGGGSTVNVNWNDILGKPSTFTPSEHNHNDLYYTEAEIDTKLGNKQNALNTNQLNAVNSGITSAKVTQYDNYASNKQDMISDLETIRDGASKGATALQEHQDISGKADKATTLAGYGIENAYTKTEVDNSIKSFVITEDMVTVETDATKGVAPYSTSYGYTNITINDNVGVRLVEGALYTFVIDTKLVVVSANRNVRIRLGENGEWIPVMNSSNAILAGHTYFAKTQTRLFRFSTSQTVLFICLPMIILLMRI